LQYFVHDRDYALPLGQLLFRRHPSGFLVGLRCALSGQDGVFRS
jgi:hypothetical protein